VEERSGGNSEAAKWNLRSCARVGRSLRCVVARLAVVRLNACPPLGRWLSYEIFGDRESGASGKTSSERAAPDDPDTNASSDTPAGRTRRGDISASSLVSHSARVGSVDASSGHDARDRQPHHEAATRGGGVRAHHRPGDTRYGQRTYSRALCRLALLTRALVLVVLFSPRCGEGLHVPMPERGRVLAERAMQVHDGIRRDRLHETSVHCAHARRMGRLELRKAATRSSEILIFSCFRVFLDSGGCNTNCNHRGYCDLSSSPPSCLCFPGFGGLECELLAPTDATAIVGAAAGSPKVAVQGAGAAAATSKTGAKASPTATAATGTGAKASTPATASGAAPARPVDRTICNPGCNADTGVCWQGKCACKDGFTGPTCSDRLCPDDCSYHGKCHRDTGECECYKPYTGATCAGATESLTARPVDTLDDVYGPVVVPLNERVNKRFTTKKGLTDQIHLLESESHVRRMNIRMGQ
jgi:hypothetical protein